MSFKTAKRHVSENFYQLQLQLQQAIDEGLLDENAAYYNAILALKDDVDMVKSWPELSEIIYRGKMLEEDIDTFLSLKGSMTIELLWPSEETDTN